MQLRGIIKIAAECILNRYRNSKMEIPVEIVDESR